MLAAGTPSLASAWRKPASRSASAVRPAGHSRPSSGRGKAAELSCSIGRNEQAGRRQHAGMRRHDDRAGCRARAPARSRAAARRRRAAGARNRAGSMPRPIETSRMPSAICALRTRWMPSAACSTTESERARDRRLDRLAREVRRELQRAAGEIIGIDVAEHDRCVGHRRLLAAAAVAGGARLRARRVRARRAASRRASIQAMLPPPAPIALTSTIGTRTG